MYEIVIENGVTLQTLAADLVKKHAESKRHKPIGINLFTNGNIRPYQPDKGKAGVSEIVKVVYEDEPSATLIASQVPYVYGPSTGYIPRSLTPTECGRLQGFPMNNWTNVVSERQTYKQFGNAVSVPVATAIAKTIAVFLNSALGGA